ncbi:hypothetical protein [Streptomyces sp. BE303]|uniref:hypothetical protein n=1 Tax=Streptomyces sp. BE303 TaxID=3002528 RepID=UPI002E79D9FB|nr:hypothetical protein [Streptomyces sp. BE303]MED7954635.1 hypothetical protein [Streptomyces sp. BE303]
MFQHHSHGRRVGALLAAAVAVGAASVGPAAAAASTTSPAPAAPAAPPSGTSAKAVTPPSPARPSAAAPTPAPSAARVFAAAAAAVAPSSTPAVVEDVPREADTGSDDDARRPAVAPFSAPSSFVLATGGALLAAGLVLTHRLRRSSARRRAQHARTLP